MVQQTQITQNLSDCKVFSLPFGVPFATRFAEALLSAHGRNTLDLADVTIWVPSRRAALALEEAFLALRPEGVVLPQIKPMHLTEEDAELMAFEAASVLGQARAPVSEHGRLLYLAQQVLMWQRAIQGKSSASIPHAYESAASLASLSDKLRTQQVSIEDVSKSIKPDLATHWEMNLKFLEIVFEHYPGWLEEQSAADPADLRASLLEELARAYRDNPPTKPVYLAGFTDTTPAGLELMKAVLASEQGRLVLQGFDHETAALDLSPTHPHYGLNRLLRLLEVPFEEVRPLAVQTPAGTLLLHSQMPSGETHRWLEQSFPPEAAEGLSFLEAPSARLEADSIAVMMRHSLETPQKTCALVTTNRQLAARVADKLRDWGITVNDSAGTPLLTTTAGSFFMLLSEVVAQKFRPQVVAQLLAHPLASGGMAKADWKTAVRVFEAHVLRGVTPGFGLVGLRGKVAEVLPRLEEKSPKQAQSVREVLEKLEEFTAPLRGLKQGSMAQWVKAHVAVGQAFAANDKGENAEVFLQQEDGETLFQQLEALMGADDHAGAMRLRDYHSWLEAFLQHATVREVYAQHPRLFIWGPLEARLQQADKIIIGGMNEGTWPNLPQPDPWLNRAMAETLGLPPREMAIGLNAHDFCALASAPDVVLTRATQEGGTPTVPSRYLLRLQAVLQNHGTTLEAAYLRGKKYLDTAKRLALNTTVPVTQLSGAQIAMPADGYPEAWSASAVGTFMQCPYRFYGEKVMRLKPFEPFDQAPDAAEKGILIHKCFEAFLTQKEGLPPPWQGPLKEEDTAAATARLMDIAEKVFGALTNNASHKVWLSRFQVAATAFIRSLISQQRQGRTPWQVERRGEVQLGRMRLHARADRIDKTPHGYVVMDYKTGQSPTKKSIARGLAPQLPLEGLILAEGGFGSLTDDDNVAGLEYWKVGQGDNPFNRSLDLNGVHLENALEATRAGLRALEETFMIGGTPLAALPEKDVCRLCDFAGLCRRHEWQEENTEDGAT